MKCDPDLGQTSTAEIG